MPFFVPEKQNVHFLYQLIDGSFSHDPFKAGNNILHTYRTIAMDCLKVHLGLSFSSIDILCWSLQFQEIGHIWKLLCYDVDKQSNLIIGVIFFRDEDDRLLILILVASFIIISMIVIIGVVRFFSYCILSFSSLSSYISSLLGGQLRSSLLWGRALLFWCRVTGVKVKAVTPKLFTNVAHNDWN